MPSLRLWRRRGITAARSGNRKRAPLPQNSVVPLNNAFSLAGPITLTLDLPPTNTQQTTTTTTPPPPPPPPITTSPTPTSTLQPPPGTTLPPSPVASVLPGGDNDGSDTDQSLPPASSSPSTSSDLSSTSTKTIPAGAIVGIVIAAVLLLLVLVVLLVRRSFRQNRLQRRATWLNGPGPMNQMMATAPAAKTASSFAPAPVSQQSFGAPTIPVAGAASMALAAVSYTDPSGGELSPGYAFADAQSKALASRGVPTPPPMAYNTTPLPVAVAAAPVSPRTIPASLSGTNATVKFTFIPSLPDELSISNGEVVTVLQEYDDGWALCVNGRGVQGMVPLECLDNGDPTAAAIADKYVSGGGGNGGNGDARNSRRASSLNIVGASGPRR